jgi:hypothetical protein
VQCCRRSGFGAFPKNTIVCFKSFIFLRQA